jgi:hypothetical protein
MRRVTNSQRVGGSGLVIFLLFSLVVMLVAMWLFLGWRKVEKNTVYGPGFKKNRFSHLLEGATLDQVYGNVGPPLFIDVNPDRQGNGAYRQTRDDEVSLQHAKNLVADTNTEIYLVYSSMRRSSKDYYLYRLDVWDSKVFRRIERQHMD